MLHSKKTSPNLIRIFDGHTRMGMSHASMGMSRMLMTVGSLLQFTMVTPTHVSQRSYGTHSPRCGQAMLALLSRRAVLHSAAALPLFAAAAPLFAATVCSCPEGSESCVCVEKDLPKAKKRADAAGRDAAQSRADVAALRAELDEMERIETGPKVGPMPKGAKPEEDRRNVLDEKQRRASEAKSLKANEAPATSAPADPGFLGLTGGSSQNFGEVDKNGAEMRFQAIVAETARKREADFGFELDDDDIRQIEEVLRPKYCGPQGLIGPCLTASPKK